MNENPVLSPVRAPNTTAYRSESARSRQLYQRALGVMPGGNSRHSISLSPYPVYAASGRGCRITDVEGEERIDFLNNYTALILGHADPRVTEAVTRRVARGTAFAQPTESDVQLAELLRERVPAIERIRFCNSGSEAVLLAIKAARSFTGRAKIAKFEGAYHGIYDYVQVSEAPSPDEWGPEDQPSSVVESSSAPGVGRDVVVLPWNNFEVCRALIEENKQDLAAVIADPLPLGIGMIAPKPGFLEFLREITARHGILLISDEVLTFRLSYRGAMDLHGIQPDLISLGKIIGGGFPVGAVAGSEAAMSVFDHTKGPKTRHGGTFNANPVTTAAGLETMQQMTPEAYDRLDKMGEYIRERLKRELGDRGVPVRVCGKGSLFVAHLSDAELVDFRSIKGFSRTSPAYGALCHEMLGRGIVTSARGLFGCLSTPMGPAELDAFVEAAGESVAQVNFKG